MPGRALPLAVGVALGLLLAQAATAVLGRLQGLLVIVVVSLFLSFAMEPAVQWMARRGIRRGVGTWAVFLGGFLLFAVFATAMAALVIDQARNLVNAGPELLGDIAVEVEDWLPAEVGAPLREWLEEQQQALPQRLTGLAGTLGRGAVGISQTVLGGVFQLATIGLVTFYLTADGPRLRKQLASRLEPRDQVRVLGLWELAVAKTGGYVYSRFIIMILSSIFHITVFLLIGLDYAFALGLWVGIVSSLIPAIGTYLAGALPVIVALASSPPTVLWVIGAIVVYQQVENYLVMPRITHSTMQVHPAIAFLSVLAGAALGGVTGALLAIPAVAIGTALISAAGEEYEVLEHHLIESGPRPPAGDGSGGGDSDGTAATAARVTNRDRAADAAGEPARTDAGGDAADGAATTD